MKQHYWAGLLRFLANEDNSIIALWKKITAYLGHRLP
jgi:hypothetical protein